MKKSLMIPVYVLSLVVVILAIMNVSIWQKEQILADGEIVYVKLAPADPRSLMQGDYMRLRYAIDNEITKSLMETDSYSLDVTTVVVSLDDYNKASFARLDMSTDDVKKPLSANEKRFRLSTSRYRPHIMPNTFLFQEGHAAYYEEAEYGVFTFAKGSSGSYVLTGLADKNLQVIEP